MTREERAEAESIAAEVGGSLGVLLGLLVTGRTVRQGRDGAFYVNGRKVSEESIRKLLDRIQQVASQRARTNGDNLIAKRIDNKEFVRRHNVVVAASIFLGAALVLGSLELAAGNQDVIAEINNQSKYARKMGRQVQTGKAPAETLNRRVAAYFLALFVIFHRLRKQQAEEIGYTEARRYLGAAEHCQPNPFSGVRYKPNDCPGWAKKGWVPMDQMPPIGALNCRQFCKCWIRYR